MVSKDDIFTPFCYKLFQITACNVKLIGVGNNDDNTLRLI